MHRPAQIANRNNAAGQPGACADCELQREKLRGAETERRLVRIGEALGWTKVEPLPNGGF
jgi:hypothetical protein